MRRGLQLSIALGIGVLGVAALLAWFDAEVPIEVRSAPAELGRQAVAEVPVAKPAGGGPLAALGSQAAMSSTQMPAGADLDAQALQLLTPYLRECGDSAFAVQGGYGDSMYEFRGVTRTVNRLGISPSESLERVDWTGSVSVAWQDGRKRCLDCEEEWQDWTGGGAVLMEARHKNGAWKAGAPNATFIQLQPSWTCDWFQRAAKPPPSATESPEN